MSQTPEDGDPAAGKPGSITSRHTGPLHLEPGTEDHSEAIIFTLASGEQAMVLKPNGQVLIYGRPIGRDTEVFDAMRAFLGLAAVDRRW